MAVVSSVSVPEVTVATSPPADDVSTRTTTVPGPASVRAHPSLLEPPPSRTPTAVPVEPPPEPPPASREAPAGGVSFVELWSDSEREAALDVERALGAGDVGSAIMACDVLLTRVLASAAGLAGHADAPRDPALVPLLLGLDGRRYLAFRALVRGARTGEGARMNDALDAYVFALEARRARDAIGR